jgi:hypothetical protein
MSLSELQPLSAKPMARIEVYFFLYLALEGSCCHRRGGLLIGTQHSAFAGMTWIKNTLDQLSQLMWAKIAVDPIVTL